MLVLVPLDCPERILQRKQKEDMLHTKKREIKVKKVKKESQKAKKIEKNLQESKHNVVMNDPFEVENNNTVKEENLVDDEPSCDVCRAGLCGTRLCQLGLGPGNFPNWSLDQDWEWILISPAKDTGTGPHLVLGLSKVPGIFHWSEK